MPNPTTLREEDKIRTCPYCSEEDPCCAGTGLCQCNERTATNADLDLA